MSGEQTPPDYMAAMQRSFGVPAKLGEVTARAVQLAELAPRLTEVSAYGGMVVTQVEAPVMRTWVGPASALTETQG